MFWRVFLVKVLIVRVLALPDNSRLDSPQRIYNTPEIIQSFGYVSERHHVTTSDGYILEMHRIPFRRHETSGSPDRPVVFLMHGLFAASSHFIALGPDYSIPYNLADAGYDVWMGNARGTRNSRFHITLDPGKSEDRHEFWDFSFHEIGSIDIANMVDYVLDHSGQERLHYIGHSQGGAVFLVLTTVRPEYNHKFASVHLMAGVGYVTYMPNTALRTVAQFSNILYPLALSIGFLEMFPPLFPRPEDDAISNFDIYSYCAGSDKYKYFCELIGLREIMDDRIINIPIPELPELPDYGVGGASFKQIVHFGQNIKDNMFRGFDYGTVQNLQLYGRSHPPIYNLSLITADVTMHYTISDSLLDPRDVHAMADDMPNTKVRRVARDSFLHADFTFSEDVKELVTDYIIEQIADVASRPPPPIPTPPPENSGEEDNGNGSASSIVLGFVLQLYLIIYSFHSTRRLL